MLIEICPEDTAMVQSMSNIHALYQEIARHVESKIISTAVLMARKSTKSCAGSRAPIMSMLYRLITMSAAKY